MALKQENLKENILLSVIIVTYNGLDDLKECLNSINKYNDISDALEIIVVDNSPSDNILNYLKNNFPNVLGVKNKNNGFGSGNNVGARRAKGKYLLFLNPDTVLIEPIFQHAIKKFEADHSLGLFGFKMLDTNLKENHSFNYRMTYGFLRPLYTRICKTLKIFDSKRMYTSGANIFIPKDIFFQCGMFDENIFLYGEETDLCIRVNKMNYKISYFREKCIIHKQGKSTGNNLIVNYFRRMTSYKYICKKYGFDYKKILNAEIRYIKFKKNVFKLLTPKKYIVYENLIQKLLEEYSSS